MLYNEEVKADVIAWQKDVGNSKLMLQTLSTIARTSTEAPALVFTIGLHLLNKHTTTMLEIENASFLESIFYACLECGRKDWGRVAYNMLKQHCGETPKGRRLEAVLLNAEDKPQEAYQRLYSILKVAPCDTLTWKTLITIKQANGDLKESMDDLQAYLMANQADVETWQYLSQIYISHQLYKEAMHCYEELILTYHQNYYVHVVYAELLCTEGKKETRQAVIYYPLARKYAAHAVNLNSTSPRALWLLLHICQRCQSFSKTENSTNTDLLHVAQEGIKKIYSTSPVSKYALAISSQAAD